MSTLFQMRKGEHEFQGIVNTTEAFILFGIEHLQDHTDEEGVPGFFPDK